MVHNIGITEASECQTISSETQRKTVSFCIVRATARIHPPHTKDMDADCGKRLRKALYASVNNLQKRREETLWESVSLEDISLCPLLWNITVPSVWTLCRESTVKTCRSCSFNYSVTIMIRCDSAFACSISFPSTSTTMSLSPGTIMPSSDVPPHQLGRGRQTIIRGCTDRYVPGDVVFHR